MSPCRSNPEVLCSVILNMLKSVYAAIFNIQPITAKGICMGLLVKMKISISAIIFVIAGTFLAHGSARGEDKFLIMTEIFPPFNYSEDGKLKGISADVVGTLLARMDLKNEIKVYPWARAFHFLNTRANAVLFTVARTQAREDKFRWVGPLAESRLGLFGLKSRNFRIESIEAARSLLIGVERNANSMEILQSRNFENLDPSADPITNLKKLLGGRNDLWFQNSAVVAETLRQLGKIETQIEMVYEFKRTRQFIAFNKQIPEEVSARWQANYNSMINDGTVQRIFEKYSATALYPSSLK